MDKSTFASQTKDLIQKNFKIFTKNPKYLLILALAPILSCLYISYFEKELKKAQNSFIQKDFPIEKIDKKMKKCRFPQNCLTVGYLTFGKKEKWIDDTMEFFSQKSGLEFGKDVKFLGETFPKNFQNLIKIRKNTTQSYVIFCTDTWKISLNTSKVEKFGLNFLEKSDILKYEEKFKLKNNKTKDNTIIEFPCKFQKFKNKKLVFYTLAYNDSLEFSNPYFTDQNLPFPMSKSTLSLKQNLDEALLNIFKTEKGEFNYDLSHQAYPRFGLRFKRESSFIANTGSFYFFLSTTVIL